MLHNFSLFQNPLNILREENGGDLAKAPHIPSPSAEIVLLFQVLARPTFGGFFSRVVGKSRCYDH